MLTTDHKKEILRRAAKVADGKEMALFKEILELENRLNGVLEQFKTLQSLKKGDPGEPGSDGEDYVLTESDKKEIASKIKVPVVEKEVRIVEKTEVIKEQPIVTEVVKQEIKEVAVPDTPEETRDKLQSLKGDERLDKTAIKGLDEDIKRLDQKIDEKPTGRSGGMRKVPIIKRCRLTDQVDGNTRSFKLPKDTVSVLGLWGTQFPVTFDDADWTFAGNTLTLAAEVGTPEGGQTLIALVETLFY